MKRTALALALGALSTTAVMAADGDAWYGTNRAERVYVAPRATYTEPTSDRVTVYYDQPSTTVTAPVIVEERQYVGRPYGYVVVEPEHDNDLFVVEPRTYSRVDRGLFNRRGPNDFGQ